MGNLQSDIKNASKDIAQNGQRGLQVGADQVQNISRGLGHNAGMMAAKLSDTVNDYYKTSRSFVAENPVKGIAIAALAGIFTGGLLTLAMRRSH